VLSVVEAKRASRNPREGEEQLRQYITEIARNQDFAPFGFMGNGLNTWFWEVGLAHPRLVANFFSPADLERLLFIRQNRQPLASIAIDTSIVDRAYQHEAIRRVCEASGAAVQGDGGALAAVRGADEVREGAAASGLGFIGRSRSRQVRLRRSQS
jgi:type I site-specific restriction endonuclease